MNRKKYIAVFAGLIGSFGAFFALFNLRGKREKRIAAHSPLHLPWSSHRSIIAEVFNDMNAGNTMTLAAGIAYFAALAFFPLFAASFAIASIVIAQEQVATVVRELNVYLPQDIAALITAQLEAQSGKSSGNFVVAVIAIGIAVFGASAAVENTLRSLNIAYGVRETRSLVKLRGVSIVVLVLALVFAACIALLLIVDDYMIGWGVPASLVEVIGVVRWPLLLVMVSWGFAALYRYGPDRPRAKWRWASWGATIATTLWLVATSGLFLYTRYFATFSESYTLFAGIVVLMVWFNLSALALLIGAHINARLETKTSLVTTR